jgi:hypothetical protein
MNVTIESTEEIVKIDGVKTRLWKGMTDTGINVHCFIHRISPQRHDQLEQFENELIEKPKPITFEHHRQDSDETLYKKIALMISVENGEKIVSLSDPIKNYKKPAWNVNLNKDECMVLAHALLREIGVRCARKKIPTGRNYGD